MTAARAAAAVGRRTFDVLMVRRRDGQVSGAWCRLCARCGESCAEGAMDESDSVRGAGRGGRRVFAAAVYDHRDEPESAGGHSSRHGVGVSADIALGQLPDGVGAVVPQLRNSSHLGGHRDGFLYRHGIHERLRVVQVAVSGCQIIFPLVLFGMFIPYQSILIPLFQFLRSNGLYGGLPGLIVVHVVYGLPITTLIFRNFYAQIPDDLLESATLGRRGVFRHLRANCIALVGAGLSW